LDAVERRASEAVGMPLVVSGGSATASEEQEAPHTTFARRAAAAHARLGMPLLGSQRTHHPGRAHSHRTRWRGAPLRLVRCGVFFGGVLLQGLVTGCFFVTHWWGASAGADWSLMAWPRTGRWWDDAAGRLNLLGSFERACSAFFLCPGRRSRLCRHVEWGCF
jgi:hypothetical protein